MSTKRRCSLWTFPLFLSSSREVYEQFAFRKGFDKEQHRYKKKLSHCNGDRVAG